MTTEQLEARANDRAHAQHVHVFAVPGRPGVYQTTSKSEPGVKYSLVRRGAETACSCRGFSYRQNCKHVEALKNRIARETVASERAARKADANDLYS